MIITPLALTIPSKKCILSPSYLDPAFIVGDNTFLGLPKEMLINLNPEEDTFVRDAKIEDVYWINGFGWCSIWMA